MVHRTRKPASPGEDASDTPGGPSADPIAWAVQVLGNPNADRSRRSKAVRAAARYIAGQPAKDRARLLALLRPR
jgi:hypothetical protein